MSLPSILNVLRLFQRGVRRAPARPELIVPSGAVVALQSGQVCTLRAAAGWRLRVESGSLWVTEATDQADHYLTDAGPDAEPYVIRKRGLVVIECLGSATARFRVEPEQVPEEARLKAPRPETERPRTRPDARPLAAPWRGPSSA